LNSSSEVKSFGSAESDSARLVAEISRRLGMTPPMYKLIEQKETGFWSGYPQFDELQAHHFPAALGKVTNVFGKKLAKEEMAQVILKHLEVLEKERQAQAQAILGSSVSRQKD
jgi:endonuclease/exonuclease/phosphatase family metal-dependent hydrolase